MNEDEKAEFISMFIILIILASIIGVFIYQMTIGDKQREQEKLEAREAQHLRQLRAVKKNQEAGLCVDKIEKICDIKSLSLDKATTGKVSGSSNGHALGFMIGIGLGYGKSSGSINGEITTETYYYFYKIINDNDYKLDNIKTSEVIIRESDNEKPSIIEEITIDYNTCHTTNRQKVIIIPKNSIINSFNPN